MARVSKSKKVNHTRRGSKQNGADPTLMTPKNRKKWLVKQMKHISKK